MTFLIATLSDMTVPQEQRARRRAVIYCRISDDREGRQAGVGRQETECRRLAGRLGWDVVIVLTDNDTSAYSGKPRPQYEQMLEMLRSGEADAVLALAPTRLYRRIGDALGFLDLVSELDLAVQTVKAGRYDLTTADGRRDARRAAVDNQYESELISERVKDAKAENLAAGSYRGGPRPYGYEADGMTIRESEAKFIRSAIEAVIGGESLRSIASEMAKAGARTVERRYRQPDGTRGEPESREWEPEQLRKMLLRARNAGLIEHNGEVVGKAQWDGVLDEETWRAAADILENPERRTTTGNARKWLGGGLFLCGVCGGPLKASSAGSRERNKATGQAGEFQAAYRCRNAGTAAHVTRLVVLVDRMVEDTAIERLSRPDAVERLLPAETSGPTRRDLDAAANTLRAKLDSITDDYSADLITRKQMLEMTEATRRRLAEVTEQMAARSTRSVLASLPLGTSLIAEQWPGYHLDKKRAIIDALMTVTVLPAKRGRPAGFKPDPGGRRRTYFDPNSVKIEWKEPASS